MPSMSNYEHIFKVHIRNHQNISKQLTMQPHPKPLFPFESTVAKADNSFCALKPKANNLKRIESLYIYVFNTHNGVQQTEVIYLLACPKNRWSRITFSVYIFTHLSGSRSIRLGLEYTCYYTIYSRFPVYK